MREVIWPCTPARLTVRPPQAGESPARTQGCKLVAAGIPVCVAMLLLAFKAYEGPFLPHVMLLLLLPPLLLPLVVRFLVGMC